MLFLSNKLSSLFNSRFERENIVESNNRIYLKEGWQIISSTQVKEDGDIISSKKYRPQNWYPTSIPSTVLSALIKNNVYPDFRFGLNSFLIPDASDEFNEKYDLEKFSYLPDKRNPWLDPYWYRTEFILPETKKKYWLVFNGINYRADVWLNGKKVASAEQIVGAFQRYKLDITDYAEPGKTNYLAVKIHQVDHPGVPDTQLDVFGKDRGYRKEIMKDITLVMFIGYDCMPTVPDRNMGIWQDVYIESTGTVDIMNPFIKTKLPLPQTSPAKLYISTELINTTESYQEGILKGTIDGELRFEKKVRMKPNETIEVNFSPDEYPQLVIDNPRLWWPNNYGEQNLYNLNLTFEIDGEISDEENTTFGIREITKELYELDGAHGLRLHINDQKIFCRGGYIQPEITFNWDRERMETEIKYFTEANLNLIYFEDIPNPPDEFLDLCDKYGLMFGNCFYGCYWMQPGTEYPLDIDLLDRGTIDIIKRYRNHPSLIMYMAMNEGETREDVYENWRKNVINLDGTRFFIPSGSFPDYRKDVPEWIKKDIPVGMNDYPPKSYGWQFPPTYFRWVQEERNWMLMMESGSASLPPIDSLRKFIPKLGEDPEEAYYPLNKIWAHHGANHYYKDYDSAIRRQFGSPISVEDYCMKGRLVTAEQHRAMFEAVNHRIWDITSGFTEWKINACWPSVQWQIFDWFLKPMVSYYYIKSACEMLHVQLNPLDQSVSVINNYLEPQRDLKVIAKVFDFNMRLIWEDSTQFSIDANKYREVFMIPKIKNISNIYFVKLELRDINNKVISDNFYWLSSKLSVDDTYCFVDLKKLPTVKLNTVYEIENDGENTIVYVYVENPSDKLAFFIHLALSDPKTKEEILPVFWENNYFNLLPWEKKELKAILYKKNIKNGLFLEVGGWNIQSDFECSDLKLSKSELKAGEELKISADIGNTFIDGSIVELFLDNKIIDSKIVWAREDQRKRVDFSCKINEPGSHKIRIGNQFVDFMVHSGH